MPFSPQPTCDVTIDVSHHQGQIDWAAMKDTGIQCVMIKATQGLGKDSRWEINRDGARQQGLLIIPYIFLTSAVGPVEQAGFFIQTAGLYISNQEIDGISTPVDASLFSGSEAELTAWCQTGALPASLAAAMV